MSWHDCVEPVTEFAAVDVDPIEVAVIPRTSDIGGFEVRRALPSRRKRMVGPFIFFDEMGPSEFLLGSGLDVRPHPHIGLATLTYLFRGEILHRDSIGTVQPIRPGEVNWMTAGRGIAHSERTPPELRARAGTLYGIQAWVALPERHEETQPVFAHHAEAELPVIDDSGVHLRLIAGNLGGRRSPVKTLSETLYAAAELVPGAVLPVDAGYEERALYIAEGEVEIAGRSHGPQQLLVLRPGDTVSVTATQPARLLVLGGEPMEGPRYIWWNFVSTRRERIEQAKSDWRAGRFDRVVEENEFIPLPDMPGP